MQGWVDQVSRGPYHCRFVLCLYVLDTTVILVKQPNQSRCCLEHRLGCGTRNHVVDKGGPDLHKWCTVCKGGGVIFLHTAEQWSQWPLISQFPQTMSCSIPTQWPLMQLGVLVKKCPCAMWPFLQIFWPLALDVFVDWLVFNIKSSLSTPKFDSSFFGVLQLILTEVQPHISR